MEFSALMGDHFQTVGKKMEEEKEKKIQEE